MGKKLFERRLTDFAGGNISLRKGDRVYITPRYSGTYQHWDIDPATILCGDIDSDEWIGNPHFSREGKAHLAVYRTFTQAQAIIHAHPFHVAPFCAANKSIEPVLEATEELGSIEPISYAPSNTPQLVENIIAGLQDKADLITKFASVLMLPRHGLFVVSDDIFRCIDAIERVDWNCYCLLSLSKA